jgi:carbon storage regulator
MLILTRKVGESIVIDSRIVVTLLRQDGDSLKMGIDAPIEVPVHRQEVYLEILQTNRQALMSGQRHVPKLNATTSPSVQPQ